MAYVPVPKDLNAVKTKAMFNLTKRQLICFGSGAVIAIPLFFLLKSFLNVSAAAIVMILVMVPFVLLGMYEKNGQPFEKVVKNMAEVLFIKPKQRPYMTNNYYAVLERQDKLDMLDENGQPIKEVELLIHKSNTEGCFCLWQRSSRSRPC